MHDVPTEEHPALAPRAAIWSLPAYSAGRDAAAVRRDTSYQGLIIKLPSNEGAEGPFPAARTALESVSTTVQRYPGPRTRLVYICTPNNPTGGPVSRSELTPFLEDLPARVLPIIDEAYFEYVTHPDYPDPVRISSPCARPAVVLRTFSKIYGLTGL